MATTYDPGTPTTPRQVDATTWAIDSFKTDTAYLVKIEPTGCSCSCPHYTARLAGTDAQCKHIVTILAHIQAHKPTELGAAAARARKLSDEKLKFWLQQHAEQGNLVIAGACRLEAARRQVEANRDAALKALWL